MHSRTITNKAKTKQSLTGFTLIEVMVVVVLIGLMASAVQFTFNGNDPDKVLDKESQRFSAIFNTAAEYSMLNNIELGLMVEDNTYQFLAFDGEAWVRTSDTPFLAPYTLPETVAIVLTLDDLPLDEPPLINVLHEENEASELEFSGSELDEEEKLIPQVYILSGGDLTPFTLRFQLTDRFDADSYISYVVSGLYETPLTIEGPLFDE
ncbi:type II secretion system minor pseudopilin GspH [Pseudocolwellia sp. AS88]|uniref:type II secretion system minor pseudopilin GspH n=1 Tax=Pseudocolwellia sp. AS88 TaxID=3063958 RepID=UPI0026EE3B0E|nr:type II secretion system minor pseudopilin GspH [Pseudocolwellia sp. AS88]MDO7083599.1 type II secretion system minor pseudopilin GspH [Pseudocolwellia sp. AS88]